MAKINENLEQTKARNRAWFDFQKPPGEQKPVTRADPVSPQNGRVQDDEFLLKGKPQPDFVAMIERYNMKTETSYKAFHQYVATEVICTQENDFIVMRYATAEQLQHEASRLGDKSNPYTDVLQKIIAHMDKTGTEIAGEAMLEMGLLENLDADAIIDGSQEFSNWLDFRSAAEAILSMQEVDPYITAAKVAEAINLSEVSDPEGMIATATEVLERLHPKRKEGLIRYLQTEPEAIPAAA